MSELAIQSMFRVRTCRLCGAPYHRIDVSEKRVLDPDYDGFGRLRKRISRGYTELSLKLECARGHRAGANGRRYHDGTITVDEIVTDV